jgi:hypothetical protein
MKPVTLPVATLHQGWNLISFNDPAGSSSTSGGTPGSTGQVRTLLVYGDDIPPTLSLSKSSPLTVNKADVDNGSTYFLAGNILDDSFGSRDFRINFKLNDTKYIANGIQTDSQGNMYVAVRLVIKDFAGNKATQVISDPNFKTDASVLAPEAGVVKVILQVTTTAPLLAALGQKNLPPIIPSETLIALLDGQVLIPPPNNNNS